VGFSAMVWSHAVGPEGHVTTLEFDSKFAEISKRAWAKEGITNIDVIVGDARES